MNNRNAAVGTQSRVHTESPKNLGSTPGRYKKLISSTKSSLLSKV